MQFLHTGDRRRYVYTAFIDDTNTQEMSDENSDDELVAALDNAEKEIEDEDEKMPPEVNNADKDETYYIQNDSVRKWQYNLQDTVLLGDMYPENSVQIENFLQDTL